MKEYNLQQSGAFLQEGGMQHHLNTIARLEVYSHGREILFKQKKEK